MSVCHGLMSQRNGGLLHLFGCDRSREKEENIFGFCFGLVVVEHVTECKIEHVRSELIPLPWVMSPLLGLCCGTKCLLLLLLLLLYIQYISFIGLHIGYCPRNNVTEEEAPTCKPVWLFGPVALLKYKWFSFIQILFTFLFIFVNFLFLFLIHFQIYDKEKRSLLNNKLLTFHSSE